MRIQAVWFTGLIIAAPLLFAPFGCGAPERSATRNAFHAKDTVRKASWRLVWSDDFEEDGRPQDSKWRYQTGGHGWGNEERQTYTANDTSTARVRDGYLILEAHKTGPDTYTSARLNSEASWTYGRFEIRAKLPTGRGTWPAIWMLPDTSTADYGDQYWPDNGEIDIMEHVGYDPGVVHGTVHTRAFNHMQGTQRGRSVSVPDAMTAFHTYALEWTPAEIRISVDEQEYFTFQNRQQYGWEEWPFNQDFHLLLNIAVGGTWGGAQGIDDSIFPQQMIIDYVKVYAPAAAPSD